MPSRSAAALSRRSKLLDIILSEGGHAGKRFRLMLANPSFGVEWKRVEHIIRREHEALMAASARPPAHHQWLIDLLAAYAGKTA